MNVVARTFWGRCGTMFVGIGGRRPGSETESAAILSVGVAGISISGGLVSF